jgi:hypothetical protein
MPSLYSYKYKVLVDFVTKEKLYHRIYYKTKDV